MLFNKTWYIYDNIPIPNFTFLGSEVEKEGRCDKEIKQRVAIRKATMIGLEKLWRDKHVSINTKKG